MLFYNIFDALLLTSKIEGTPISIIEALMCGLPIFTTPVGQIENNYSNLHGVNMLSGDAGVDAESLRSFDYDIHRSAWSDVTRSANEHNDPGHFTTFIGYEFTTSTDIEGANLHRNVIFNSNCNYYSDPL